MIVNNTIGGALIIHSFRNIYCAALKLVDFKKYIKWLSLNNKMSQLIIEEKSIAYGSRRDMENVQLNRSMR